MNFLYIPPLRGHYMVYYKVYPHIPRMVSVYAFKVFYIQCAPLNALTRIIRDSGVDKGPI